MNEIPQYENFIGEKFFHYVILVLTLMDYYELIPSFIVDSEIRETSIVDNQLSY